MEVYIQVYKINNGNEGVLQEPKSGLVMLLFVLETRRAPSCLHEMVFADCSSERDSHCVSRLCIDNYKILCKQIENSTCILPAMMLYWKENFTEEGQMHKKPKAIILDLDGTLLHTDKSISPRTLKVIEQCKNAGILVIVATARFWFKAEKYLEMIRPDYAILADGTQIYRNDEMICGFAMSEQSVNGVIQALKKQEPFGEFVVSVGKELLCSASGISEQWRRSYAFEDTLSRPVYKIAAMLESADVAEKLSVDYDCRLYSYRDENLYGFTAKEAGKYQAVRALSKFLGIDLQDMVAFGDDENDYEILKYCGTGVAMANAIPQIREVADTITDSNDEDGVAAYLERYFTNLN